jgi:hypothetical protein
LKKLASSAAGLALVAVLAGRGQADRIDALAASPMADITDVYAWMNGTSFLNLIMDVSPKDNGSTSFGPSVLYVFHLTSKAGIGVNQPGGTETQVICRFASNTSVECWVVSGTTTKDYVSGDPSNRAGVSSLLGKVKVFAGRRSDPSFWKFTSFNSAIATFRASLPSATVDGAGCPMGLGAQTLDLRTALAGGSDDFAATNVMAIVLQIDKSLINVTGNVAVGVWGSTHAGT